MMRIPEKIWKDLAENKLKAKVNLGFCAKNCLLQTSSLRDNQRNYVGVKPEMVIKTPLAV